MKTTINLLSKTIAALALTLPLNVFAVDENGNYFTNDFEDNIPMTEGETTGGMAINVEGEGEWLFKLAFVSTNTSYVVSGTQNLRLKKNGSYVITPVLNKGVKEISFNCKRKGKGIDVYTSVDAGATWTKVSTVSSTGVATIAVNDTQVNRVKMYLEQVVLAAVGNMAQLVEFLVYAVADDAALLYQLRRVVLYLALYPFT